MKKVFSSFLLVAFWGVFPLAGMGAENELTTRDLLREMSSLDWLGRSFAPGASLVQFSSYDRRTRIVNGDTVDWWANADLGHYLRQEVTNNGVEFVMAEAEGPGAIVRLWSANPGRSIWRIYLDNSPEPVITARGKDLLGGKVKPWGTVFSARRNLGYNLIFPILFSKKVKVTVQGKGHAPPLMYYHIGLRLFPRGTPVRTFSFSELAGLSSEMDSVSRILAAPDHEFKTPAGEMMEAEIIMAPGAEGELFTLSGPAAVAGLELTVKSDEKNFPAVLGQNLLLMQWDDEARPAVAVPLGDFFGTSPGVNELSSLPLSMYRIGQDARLVARWVMPFRKTGRIWIKNQSGRRLHLFGRIVVMPWNFGPDSRYFHAAFRQLNRLRTRPFKDLRLLAVNGQGHFVGLEMNVRNPMEYFWWGEGDEKVWVDGDGFPSIFGTGTEDYFGYAWCAQYFKFIHAYHGVSLPTREWLVIPQAMPVPYLWESISRATRRQAVVSQYRFQVLDAVPFEREFRFDMELYHHRDTTVDVNATAFWYAAPGSADDVILPDLQNREMWEK